MPSPSADRRHALSLLLRSEELGSQEDVLARLRAAGFAVTQATVSRDLEQLGAVKLRRDGRMSYALPDDSSATPDRDVQAILRQWVRSVEAVGNLVVVKTPPGSAHLVGVVIDEAGPAGVAGTICGDDTIFIAIRDPAAGPGIVDWLFCRTS